MQTATATLGITWDTAAGTYDAGDGDEPLATADLDRIRADIEAWAECAIADDEEAASDWDAFAAAVYEAQADAYDYGRDVITRAIADLD